MKCECLRKVGQDLIDLCNNQNPDRNYVKNVLSYGTGFANKVILMEAFSTKQTAPYQAKKFQKPKGEQRTPTNKQIEIIVTGHALCGWSEW